MLALIAHNIPSCLHQEALTPLAAALRRHAASVSVVEVAELEGYASKADVLLARVIGAPAWRKVDAAAQAGVPTLNMPGAVRLVSNKLAAAHRLHEAGLRVPMQSALCPDGASASEVVQRFGLPVVVKPVVGMNGEGVEVVETRPRLAEVMSARRPSSRWLVQQYLPSAASGDVRVLVVDGETVASMRRVPQPGSYRANLHANGSAQPHVASADERSAAEAAAAVCGVGIAGVDLVPSDDGPIVLEVNAVPGLQVGQVANVDVPGAVASAVARRAGMGVTDLGASDR